MNKQETKEKIEGIGGWLIIPIIGFFVSIGMQLFSLLDFLAYYSFDEVYFLILITLVLLVLPIMCLYNIFKKNRIAKPIAIGTYILYIIVGSLTMQPYASVGGLIWMLYFMKSKRVKNTLVN